MSAHRHGDVRPRYGRIAVAALSTGVTALAVLGGVGALPVAAEPAATVSSLPVVTDVAAATEVTGGTEEVGNLAVGVRPDRLVVEAAARAVALPLRSGQGRRVVYSEERQRVWLVGGDGDVRRTYLVSGSVYDNLDPGTYTVYSRSEQAWGIDDSGSMRWFVRFTQGDRGAAIGFHDIPVDDGQRVQGPGQLGTPTSHGCIRQRTADAKALWAFAPVGTTVVVTS